MSNLYRRSYKDHELDPADGPTPTFANPGSIGRPDFGLPSLDGRCVPCGVQWVRADQPECWLCGVDPRAVAL